MAILKNALFLSRPFWNFFLKFLYQKKFFCFIPMKTSQSLLVSKDGSKFWSSQTWQYFLTQTNHYAPECIAKICGQPSMAFFYQMTSPLLPNVVHTLTYCSIDNGTALEKWKCSYEIWRWGFFCFISWLLHSLDLK